MTTESQHIAIKTSSDLSPDQTRDVRARAWAFVFDCREAKKKGTRPGAPDDAKGLENDRAETSVHDE